jgi:formylglycine-generating enzyme required for sulfatase activity
MNLGVFLIFSRWIWVTVGLAALVNAHLALFAGDPVISNVRAAQRGGTRLVDIDYDLVAPSNSLLEISVKVSDNNGASYTVPARRFTGDIGLGVKPGLAKRTTWDANADWPNQYSSRVRFRILAQTILGPDGFVWITPGTFVMGSPPNETDRDDDEVQHTVILTQGFWILDHEVTQAEFRAIMGTNPSISTADPRLPVENVRWSEAVLYCYRLTERERAAGRITAQQEYRLPTEAEWEYAARAGSTGAHYGDLNAIGWWSDNSQGQTQVVRQKAPNVWGLYDMLGNVWEWCSDAYGNYPTGSVTDPKGPSFGSGRVSRGGGVVDDADLVRLAFRYWDEPEDRFGDQGFRPVIASVPPAPPRPTGFVWIPPGTFVMGSPATEPGRSSGTDFEKQHSVALTRGFWLCDHEVTQGEYETIMGQNPSQFKGDANRPAEKVSWQEAVLYCEKLTQRERSFGRISVQHAYRLPTEAEWEYAARAGMTDMRYGGLDMLGWYNDNSDNQTWPVRLKAPNPWGLYDMLGNVSEWCSDRFDVYYLSARAVDPTGPTRGSDRVFRGGSWANASSGLRFAERSGFGINIKWEYFGFRPALSSIR